VVENKNTVEVIQFCPRRYIAGLLIGNQIIAAAKATEFLVGLYPYRAVLLVYHLPGRNADGVPVIVLLFDFGKCSRPVRVGRDCFGCEYHRYGGFAYRDGNGGRASVQRYGLSVNLFCREKSSKFLLHDSNHALKALLA